VYRRGQVTVGRSRSPGAERLPCDACRAGATAATGGPRWRASRPSPCSARGMPVSSMLHRGDRTQDGIPTFQVLPRRWVVERTLGLDHQLRPAALPAAAAFRPRVHPAIRPGLLKRPVPWPDPGNAGLDEGDESLRRVNWSPNASVPRHVRSCRISRVSSSMPTGLDRRSALR
jgi:hypothetical protein